MLSSLSIDKQPGTHLCAQAVAPDCNLTLNPAPPTLVQTPMKTGALKSGQGQTLSPQSLQSTEWDTYAWI